jgi:hypothetical protein
MQWVLFLIAVVLLMLLAYVIGRHDARLFNGDRMRPLWQRMLQV